jgi:hypothetical protein
MVLNTMVTVVGLGLWCLMPLSSIFQFYWWRNLIEIFFLVATGRWFSPGILVSSTNKTEKLMKVALNTINLNRLP